jgi:hypothetical protein
MDTRINEVRELIAADLLTACKPYLKDGETPAECIERHRKDAAAVFLYYNDAQRWRYVRDHWDEVGGICLPAPGKPDMTDPKRLTAYVDDLRTMTPSRSDEPK